MSFWIAAASLTVFAMLVALLPFFKRKPEPAAGRAEHDLEVYEAQLAELASDLDRGTMSAEDAASARAEIGRRLLQAARAGPGEAAKPVSGTSPASLAAIVFVALAVPATALGFYGSLGAPTLPDLPLVARAVPDPGAEPDIAALVAAAEARLLAEPEDGRGWELLAPIYLRMGQPDKAATAYRNALRLLGETPGRLAGLGEALIGTAGGEVTDEAVAAFGRALELDPAHLPSQLFVALDHSQEGRNGDALSAWQRVVDASPPDAPWLPLAQSALADANARIAAGSESPPDGGEAIAALPATEQRQAIEGMVAQLAARLQTAPDDPEGWKRLVRSYAVLGEDAKARDALATATSSFAEGTAERRDIVAFGRELGLDAGEDTTVR